MPKPITPRTYIAPPGDPADVGYLAQSVTPPRGDTVSPRMRQLQARLSAPQNFTPTPPSAAALAHQAEARARRKAQRDAAETGWADPRFPAPKPIVHVPQLSPWEQARRARLAAPGPEPWSPDEGDGNTNIDLDAEYLGKEE